MSNNPLKWVGGLKETYQPVEGFPDKITPERVEAFKKILGAIANHIGNVEGRRIIDIGSNFGYFCLELGKLGAITTGYELDKRRVDVARYMAEKDELTNTMFVSGNAVQNILWGKPPCDYALILNTIHHLFLQDEVGTWEMFNYLIDNSNGVFVMMRNELKSWKLCDKRRHIPDAVLQHSDAKQYKGLGNFLGRTLYAFSQ